MMNELKWILSDRQRYYVSAAIRGRVPFDSTDFRTRLLLIVNKMSSS